MCRQCGNELYKPFNQGRYYIEKAEEKELESTWFWQMLEVKRELLHKLLKIIYAQFCREGYTKEMLWATEEELELNKTSKAKGKTAEDADPDLLHGFMYVEKRREVRENAMMRLLEDDALIENCRKAIDKQYQTYFNSELRHFHSRIKMCNKYVEYKQEIMTDNLFWKYGFYKKTGKVSRMKIIKCFDNKKGTAST